MRRIPWIMLALLVSAAARTDTQTLAVDYFTHPADLGRVEISPDGKFLAATYEVEGGSRLAFLNLTQLGDVKEVVAPRDMDFLDFHWVSATRVLYRLALHQPGLSKGTATGSLLAIDRDGTHAQYVFGCRAASGGDAEPAKEAPASSDPANAKTDAGAGEAALRTCGTAELLSLLHRTFCLNRPLSLASPKQPCLPIPHYNGIDGLLTTV